MIKAVEPMANVVQSFLPKLPRLPPSYQVPSAEEAVEACFDFLERLVDDERIFAKRLLRALQIAEAKPVVKPAAVSLKAQLEAEAS